MTSTHSPSYAPFLTPWLSDPCLFLIFSLASHILSWSWIWNIYSNYSFWITIKESTGSFITTLRLTGSSHSGIPTVLNRAFSIRPAQWDPIASDPIWTKRELGVSVLHWTLRGVKWKLLRELWIQLPNLMQEVSLSTANWGLENLSERTKLTVSFIQSFIQ